MKNKHLTLDDRIQIQEGLNNRESIRNIAKTIDKSPSTVLREIKRHRCHKNRKAMKQLPLCVFRNDCEVTHLCTHSKCTGLCRNCYDCMSKCNLYKPSTCDFLEMSPYVCNGCTKQGYCGFDKVFYFATHAHDLYQDLLVSTREGINQTPEELARMDALVSPLIIKGQPLGHIYAHHAEEIGCSRSTLYKYLDEQLFSARNMDLPRRVRYKPRKKSTRPSITEEERLAIRNRDYRKFEQFLKENPGINVVEMDTVKGPIHSKKVLLTLLFRNCSFMIAILLDRCTQGCVREALNSICEGIGINTFKRVFPCILTDRGSEFLYPEAIECDENGEIRTKLFYCDPQCSWQKGMLERNHEFIRYVCPKGHSFDRMHQSDITLLINHINSVARDGLNMKTPYALSELMLDNSLHEFLGLKLIDPDDVNLRSDLFKK